MTSTDDNRFLFPAWGVSFVLHTVVVGLAFVFSTQMTPILQEEVFTWDVSLVQAGKTAQAAEQVETPVRAEQPTPKVMPQPPQRRVVPEVPQVKKPLDQNTEPQAPPQPIEQKVEMPQVREEPIEQRIVDVTEPNAEPVVEAKGPELVAVAAPPTPVETPPIQQELVGNPSPSEVRVTHDVDTHPPLQDPSVESASVQVAKVTESGPAVKVDHSWLAESLWRRVAELKRYPHSARINGEEGKVIIKAVIRSDGQLADVFVQKSSGHSALDAAAVEAVRLACPLHMKHAIGKSHIVVSLPIVYNLMVP